MIEPWSRGICRHLLPSESKKQFGIGDLLLLQMKVRSVVPRFNGGGWNGSCLSFHVYLESIETSVQGVYLRRKELNYNEPSNKLKVDYFSTPSAPEAVSEQRRHLTLQNVGRWCEDRRDKKGTTRGKGSRTQRWSWYFHRMLEHEESSSYTYPSTWHDWTCLPRDEA